MLLLLCTAVAIVSAASASQLEAPLASNVTCCVDWPAPPGKSPTKADMRRACEVAGDARNDGGTYLFNDHRGTPKAVCGEKLGCDCCRTGPAVPGMCHHGSGPHVPPGPPPAPTPGDPPATDVFHANLANTSCYRIPSIVQTTSGALVAFAEAREGSCGDGAVHSIAVRSSFDNGSTWGDVSFVKGPGGGMIGNPTAIATGTGKIVLIYVLHSPKCQADCGTGNGVSISLDDGKTWSTSKDVSKDWGPASGSLPGPGNGVQTSSGRLLVAAHHSAYVHDFVVWSDDEGESWTPINQTFPKMDEATITQLTNGSVMVNMRHTSAKTVGRGVAVSNDNGNTFGAIVYDKALISSVCQGSLVTFGGVTYFSNPESTTGRNHIGVRKSMDNGETWPSSTIIETGNSAGYSCLVAEPIGQEGNKGGILFESLATGSISFATFPLSF